MDSDIRAISSLEARVEELDKEVYKHSNMLAQAARHIEALEKVVGRLVSQGVYFTANKEITHG